MFPRLPVEMKCQGLLLFPFLVAALPIYIDGTLNTGFGLQPDKPLITLSVVPKPAALGIYLDNDPQYTYPIPSSSPSASWIPVNWQVDCESAISLICGRISSVNDEWVWEKGNGKCLIGAWIPKSYGQERAPFCSTYYLRPMAGSAGPPFNRASVNIAVFPKPNDATETGAPVDPDKPSYIVQG